MKVETKHIPISKIVTNSGQIDGVPKNPRFIRDERYKSLVKSIQDDPEMLDLRELIVFPVNGKFVTIAGNMRLRAMQELKFTEAPCKVLDKKTTAEKIRAYAVKDNIPYGEHDFELLANEWDSQELEDWGLEIEMKSAMEAQEDEYEIPDEIVTDIVLGDLFEIGEHRLLCGDSTSQADVVRLLGGATVDACVTDPPYCSGGFQESGKSAGSVGTDAPHKQIANDRLSTRGYQALLKQAFSNTGAPFLYAFTDWRMWVWLFDVAESCGYGVRSMIVWDKGTPGMGRGWRSQHELILWACKVTPPFDKHASGVGNVLNDKRTGNVHHTTEKPVALMAMLLSNTPFVQSVMDPFAGSGTTLIACEQLGLPCFAAELDPKYCQVIVDRMLKLDPSLKIKKNGKEYVPMNKEKAQK